MGISESKDAASANARGMDLLLLDRLKEPGLGVPRAPLESKKNFKEETGEENLPLLFRGPGISAEVFEESGVTVTTALVGGEKV